MPIILLVESDPQGLLIDEVRAVGRLDRLYLKTREGDAITFLDCLRVEGRSLSAGMRVRVTPQGGQGLCQSRITRVDK